MRALKLHRPVGVLTASLLGVSVWSCAEAPSEPETRLATAEAPREGGKGPKVRRAEPAEGLQSQTLDVRVIGSGFENGSVAEWELGGSVSANVVTNATTFISSSELVANISISGTAPLAFYDIAVTTPRGKKGVGIEKFEVKASPGNPADFRVSATFRNSATDMVRDDGGSYEDGGTIEGGGRYWWETTPPKGKRGGRAICFTFPPETGVLPGQESNLAAFEDLMGPDRSLCAHSVFHTRTERFGDLSYPGDPNGSAGSPTSMTAGGKFVLKTIEGQKLGWEWRLITDVFGIEDDPGVFVERLDADTWTIEAGAGGVDAELELMRVTDQQHIVARYEMPFKWTLRNRGN